jgi:hypothetical protein
VQLMIRTFYFLIPGQNFKFYAWFFQKTENGM